jgi:hypothetical protein
MTINKNHRKYGREIIMIFVYLGNEYDNVKTANNLAFTSKVTNI